MRTPNANRNQEERAQRLYGFRRGIGFERSSSDAEPSLEMMLEFDEKDDEPENLQDEDLEAEETWPSRRRGNP